MVDVIWLVGKFGGEALVIVLLNLVSCAGIVVDAQNFTES